MLFNMWLANGLQKTCVDSDKIPTYKYTFMRINLARTNIFRAIPVGETFVGFMMKHNVILARHLYLSFLLVINTYCNLDVVF